MKPSVEDALNYPCEHRRVIPQGPDAVCLRCGKVGKYNTRCWSFVWNDVPGTDPGQRLKRRLKR